MAGREIAACARSSRIFGVKPKSPTRDDGQPSDVMRPGRDGIVAWLWDLAAVEQIHAGDCAHGGRGAFEITIGHRSIWALW